MGLPLNRLIFYFLFMTIYTHILPLPLPLPLSFPSPSPSPLPPSLPPSCPSLSLAENQIYENPAITSPSKHAAVHSSARVQSPCLKSIVGHGDNAIVRRRFLPTEIVDITQPPQPSSSPSPQPHLPFRLIP